MTVDTPTDLALLVLRLGVGGIFLVHGTGKLHGRPGLELTTRWFESIGLRPGRVHAIAAAAIECLVGALLVVGLLTAAACAGVIGLMGTAIFTATGQRGFGVERGGWEYNGFLAVVVCALALAGPGSVSVDAAWGIGTDGAAGLAIALGLGLAGVGTMRIVQGRTTPSTTRAAS